MANRKDESRARRKPKHRPLFDDELTEAAASGISDASEAAEPDAYDASEASASDAYGTFDASEAARTPSASSASDAAESHGDPRRPTLRADLVESAPRKKSLLSAILTAKRTRGIAAVAVAVFVAVAAIASVAASAVIASREDDALQSEKTVLDAGTDMQNEEKSPADTSDDANGAAFANDTDYAPSNGTDDPESGDPDDTANVSDDTDENGNGPDTSGTDEVTDTDDSAKAENSGKYAVTFRFYLTDDVVVRVNGGTVGDALDLAGITLDAAQSQNVDRSEKITEDTLVRVDDISYEYIDEEMTVDYDTEYQVSHDLEPDVSVVTQEGIEGKAIIRYNVMYVNGVEVGREQIGSWYETYPQNQVITTGAKKPVDPEKKNGVGNAAGDPYCATVTVVPDAEGEGGTITGKDGIPRHYIRCVDVSATCYYAGGTTAIGLPADENVIGVDPSVFAYWTQVYVAGDSGDFGVRTVADTGWIEGYKIDICLNADNPAVQGFGWRPMKVYILG